jgi:TfoX/Sxy family transcriptional regulator of competence genes
VKSDKRQPLLPVSEQMKAWSAALEAELRDWPQITLRSFFGFTALYRGRTMFGLLPRTRSIFKGNAVAFRMDAADRSTREALEKDKRIAAFDKDKRRWFLFELSCDRDLHDALNYVARAFDAARSPRKIK